MGINVYVRQLRYIFQQSIFNIDLFNKGMVCIKAMWWDYLLDSLVKLKENNKLEKRSGRDIYYKLIPKVMIHELLLLKFMPEFYVDMMEDDLKGKYDEK